MMTKKRNAKALAAAGATLLALAVGSATQAEDDTREMVEMPTIMQEHMLGNMRDHVRALEDILAYLADGRGKDAADVAEARLGLSSLDLHGAAHIATFMPQPMQEAGTEMHRAASRFATLATEAEVDMSVESQQALFGALSEVTQACNACHAGYRIR